MNNPEPAARRHAVVSLREVTADNVDAILRLAVHEHQQPLVATNSVSLAQAIFRPEAWFRAIYADATPVGFVMLYDSHLAEQPPLQARYEVWRFMIDARYQGLGIGRRAMELVIAHVKSRPDASALYLGHRQEPGNAGGFYQKLGFEYTGNAEPGGDVEMSLMLR
jgi:diamine N-acetyltransferase